MARNPLQQLDVMKNASLQNRKITDCYRLLYKRLLWKHVLTNQQYHAQLNEVEIERLCSALREGDFLTVTSSVCRFKALVAVLQELLRSIYPFTNRINQACAVYDHVHDALRHMTHTFPNVTWYVEGTIDEVYEQELYTQLMAFLAKKIDDRRFLDLLTYVLQREKQYFTDKYPLRSICMNSYLQQLDHQLIVPLQQYSQPVYYVRCHSQFRIGVFGGKQVAKQIVHNIQNVMTVRLCLRIRHLTDSSRFHQYDMLAKRHPKTGQYCMMYSIPYNEMKRLIQQKGYGNVEYRQIFHRPNLINKSEVNILHIFNAELFQIARSYKFAYNQSKLKLLFFYAEGSFLKTIAYKRKTTVSKVAKSLRKHKQGYLTLLYIGQDGTEIGYRLLKQSDFKERSIFDQSASRILRKGYVRF